MADGSTHAAQGRYMPNLGQASLTTPDQVRAHHDERNQSRAAALAQLRDDLRVAREALDAIHDYVQQRWRESEAERLSEWEAQRIKANIRAEELRQILAVVRVQKARVNAR